MADLYTEQQIVGFNNNPPSDDGSEVASNLASWSGILDKLAIPLNSFASAINTAVNAAFKKTISGGPARLISGDTYPVVVGDQGAILIAQTTGNSKQIILPDPIAVGAPFALTACNPSTDGMFFSSQGGKTINGLATMLVGVGQSIGLQTDGSNWFTFGGSPQGATGDTMWTFASTSPAGFISLTTSTIGSAGSGGVFAGDLYSALYNYLWNNVSDTWAPVSGGRGSSASADFTANKTLTMPGMEGRPPVGVDPTNSVITTASTAGVNATQVAGAGGVDMHTLTLQEIPAHAHSVNVRSMGSGGDVAFVGGGSGDLTGFTGGDDPHNNMGPWRAVNWWIRL